MKRFLLMIAIICMSTFAYSKGRMQVVINYTNGIYRGVLYERIIIVEEDFLKDKPRYEGRFMDDFQEYFEGVAYIADEINASDDIVIIDILQVNSKGYVKADVTFGDNSVQLVGKGGVFGTFLNLFGDGMESLGRETALWLNTVCPPAVSNR